MAGNVAYVFARVFSLALTSRIAYLSSRANYGLSFEHVTRPPPASCSVYIRQCPPVG